MATLTKTPVVSQASMTLERKNFSPPKTRREPVDWSRELRWFQENPWIFEKHRGHWIAIHGSKLITHHADYQAVLIFCKEHRIKDPFIQYIPVSEREWDSGLSNHAVLKNSAKHS